LYAPTVSCALAGTHVPIPITGTHRWSAVHATPTHAAASSIDSSTVCSATKLTTARCATTPAPRSQPAGVAQPRTSIHTAASLSSAGGSRPTASGSARRSAPTPNTVVSNE